MLKAKNFLDRYQVYLGADLNLDDIKEGFCIFSLNMQQVVLAERDLQFKERLNSAQLLLPDGISVVWVDFFCSKPPYLVRSTGIDLAETLIQKYSNLAIIGTHLEEIGALQKKFAGKMIFSHHGFFNSQQKKEILDQIKILKPELIIIGMGSPYQEYLAAEIQSKSPSSVIIVVGGALDVWSQKLKRAPKWIRNLNFEWLFRIIQEPSRIFRFLGTVRGYVSLLCNFYAKRS